MKNVFLALVMIFIFSGCSTMTVEAGKEEMQKLNIENDVTYFCVDIIDKKECPKELLQIDIDIVPFIFGDTRFCFGFSPITPSELGMHCYYKDWL